VERLCVVIAIAVFAGHKPHIAHVDITSLSAAIPEKHGVYSLLKLDTVCFIDAACVYPKVLETICSGVVGTQGKLRVTTFVPACPVRNVGHIHFFDFFVPSVGQDCVRWKRSMKFHEAEGAVVVAAEEPHAKSIGILI
jgi:hypothetical protein